MEKIKKEISEIKNSYETELDLSIKFLDIRQKVEHGPNSEDSIDCVKLLKEIRNFHKKLFQKLSNFGENLSKKALDIEEKTTQTQNNNIPFNNNDKSCPQCTKLEQEKITLNCERMDAIIQLKSQSKLFEDLQRDFQICKREFLRQADVFKSQEKKYKSRASTLQLELSKTKKNLDKIEVEKSIITKEITSKVMALKKKYDQRSKMWNDKMAQQALDHELEVQEMKIEIDNIKRQVELAKMSSSMDGFFGKKKDRKRSTSRPDNQKKSIKSSKE